MTSAALVREIESRVASLPVRNAPALRAVRREYSKRLTAAAAADIVEIAAGLIARARVHRFLGDELIAHHAGAFRSLDRVQLERLGGSLSSWDQVDSFACCLSGPAWRENLIDDRTIHDWAASPDRWWRRTALVSTVPLNVKARGGHGDAKRTLRICTLALDDRDEMVVKALSWALRALAVQDPGAVRHFLQKGDSRIAALVRREVRAKLETGRKN